MAGPGTLQGGRERSRPDAERPHEHEEPVLSLIGLLGFATVVLLAVLLLHGYLWWRLVRSTTPPGRTRRLLTLGLVVLAVLPVGAVLLRRQDSLLSTVVQWVGFSWLGVAFYLFLTLLALEPVRLLLRRRFRSAPAAEPVAVPVGAVPAPEETPVPEDLGVADPTRRLLLARGLAVTAGAVALGTAGTGAYLANSAPVVRRVPVTLAGLDPALDGLRIVTFSDGHLSAMSSTRRFERLVDIVNAQQPDVVAIVGDLVDGELGELREEVAPLADLVSEQGVYFVTGNHEYFVDTTAWLRHLPTLGVQVLRNERVPIVRGGASVDLAGIDDRTAISSGVPGHGADLDTALDGRDDAVPVVLMAHQPVQVEQAAAAGVGLQLSGHTHGGQLWPFDYAVRLDQPAVQGLSRVGDTQLYVTTGAGYWGPPMRIGARPEVAVVELRAP
ncbi:metallophosphoesterase [Geodermatophilus obscurus]|uniref:Metallophosphoesterase n=1 Tax=Geodermatophilus obscurus (strain ATCC 25078 / DSM 43160 / JCM 3152 / CCUG 61914 / KCC A-0152 / KCTC 9177 / NBRC 13315 / NRRL B-3577 / G-20) TaxID=526225 RepID=D2SGI1_GEOOG|nr:metallophosphoesterase [Geodermatophilus obscurus]ADB72863.1 metallophosphoesterase [Geodermatophilus obscurus DSM 43160]